MGLLHSFEHDPPQGLVHHYTTYSALLGMVRDGVIWASDILYLNDSAEFFYSLVQARGSLIRAQDRIVDEREISFLDELIQELERIWVLPLTRATYVASFSEDPDSLSQWRAYGSGTGGVAIGFDPGDLGAIAREQEGQLLPCIYDEGRQEELMGTLVSDFQEQFRADCSAAPSLDEFTRELTLHFAESLIDLAPVVKHPAFREEKEWRLVVSAERPGRLQTSFRDGGSMIKPFIKLPLRLDGSKRLLIEEVVLGPTPNPGLAQESTEQYLKAAVGESCQVRLSEVPFRSW